jgi:hypothetical protein
MTRDGCLHLPNSPVLAVRQLVYEPCRSASVAPSRRGKWVVVVKHSGKRSLQYSQLWNKPADGDLRDSNKHEVTYGLVFTAGDDELRPALTPQPRNGRRNTRRYRIQ